ncbi:MAG: hypothetical protein KR126chlam3_01128 [Chlamydiae bacterium]|nr:hypothetical protein [Chlamydiota bacterium]
MSILRAIPCSVISNQYLYNWCIESYAPYVISFGAVVAACVIVKIGRAADTALASKEEYAPRSLEGRATKKKTEEPADPARAQAAKLTEEAIGHLTKAVEQIGLRQLPLHSDRRSSFLLYFSVIKNLKITYLAKLTNTHGHEEIPAAKKSQLNTFEVEFNAAIELFVDFLLGKRDFATAFGYGLLAYSLHNHSIVSKLVQFALNSNSLDSVEETLEKMDPQSERIELWHSLGQKYLDQDPVQIEGVKRVLVKLTGEKEKTSLALSTTKKCLEIGELEAGFDIVNNNLSSDENFDSLLYQFIEKFIVAGNISAALHAVVKHVKEEEKRKEYLPRIIEAIETANKKKEPLDIQSKDLFDAVVKHFPEDETREKYITRVIDALIKANEQLATPNYAQLGEAFGAVLSYLPEGEKREAYKRKIGKLSGIL